VFSRSIKMQIKKYCEEANAKVWNRQKFYDVVIVWNKTFVEAKDITQREGRKSVDGFDLVLMDYDKIWCNHLI